MNVGGLVGALLPVFFVLALGYLAGKWNEFDADQAAGLSKLALSFALPASLFVGMTEIRRELLLQQGRLVLALILAHVGLFLVAWLLLQRVKSLQGAASIICALMLATSATPVFGIAVLHPLLGVGDQPCCANGHYPAGNDKPRERAKYSSIDSPSGADSVRTQIRIEITTALGSCVGCYRRVGWYPHSEQHRKLL